MPTSPNTSRYRLKAKLGSGAMATVYRAEDTAVLRDVAVKVLHPQFYSNPTIRQRFLREARIIAQIDHPAIVPIYDIGQTDKHLYIVMRLMEGGSLATRVAKAPLSSGEIQVVIARICSALDAAHQNGVVHRDIKPENILFDQYDQAYLADFGVVKLAESTATMTGEGVIGTPAYMSPEQVSSKTTLDGRSDFYSLGVVLFELLAGDIPYHADTAMQTAMQHVLEPIPKLTSFNARISRSWQKVIDKAMAKDRDKRYQTGTEFAEAVAKTAPKSPVQVRPTDNQRDSQWRLPFTKQFGVSVGFTLLAVALIVGAFFLTQGIQARQAETAVSAWRATATAQHLAIAATTQSEQETATAVAQARVSQATRTAAITAAEAAAAQATQIRATVNAQVTATAPAQADSTATAEALCNSPDGYQYELISGPELIPPPPVSLLRNAPNPPESSASWQITNSGSCDWHNLQVRTDANQPVRYGLTGNDQADSVQINETVTITIYFDTPEDASNSANNSWVIILPVNGLELLLRQHLHILGETWITIIDPTPVPTHTSTPAPTQQTPISPSLTPTPKPAIPVVLFADNFDDGKADGWSPITGSWEVVDGQYLCVSNHDARVLIGSSNWTDYAVSADIKPIAGEIDIGILGRVTDSVNNYQIQIWQNKARIKIWKSDWKDIASVPYIATNDSWYKLRAEFLGTSLKMYINNKLIASAEDSIFPNGAIGLRCASNSKAFFDNVIVEALSE